MSELKPCQFCGGEAEVCEGSINGKMQVYGLVEHKDGCFFLADGLPTRYQQIMESEFDAWNTRAERTCEQIDVTEIHKPYTTHMTKCSECGGVLAVDEMPAPNYCPNCGAKVVDR